MISSFSLAGNLRSSAILMVLNLGGLANRSSGFISSDGRKEAGDRIAEGGGLGKG